MSKIISTFGGFMRDSNQTNWNDINVSVNSLKPGATGPGTYTLTGTGLVVPAFTGTGATQSAHGSVELLHDYLQESSIIPHIHWCPTTADAGNVKWQLEYILVNRSATLAGASTTISVVGATGATLEAMYRSDFPAVTASGILIGARFVFRLFRDPADGDDSYGHDAAAFDFGIHFERDRHGSRGATDL